jgi:hypothetical protein
MDPVSQLPPPPQEFVEWGLWIQRAVHTALIFAAAYSAYNPKWAWAVPAFQAIGQCMAPPK